MLLYIITFKIYKRSLQKDFILIVFNFRESIHLNSPIYNKKMSFNKLNFNLTQCDVNSFFIFNNATITERILINNYNKIKLTQVTRYSCTWPIWLKFNSLLLEMQIKKK